MALTPSSAICRGPLAAVLVALVLLAAVPREAEGRPSSPRASRHGPTALIGRAPTLPTRPRSMEPSRSAELPACAPEQPYTTPFDGKLALRSAYRTAKPQVFQHCPHWSGFGPVRGRRGHGGIDIAQPTGTKVRAAVAGDLVYARDPGGYGLFARIHFTRPRRAKDASCSLTEDFEIIYGHLQEEYPKGLPQPRKVKPGELVGHVGCTGNARGMCSPSPESHLHVTVQHATSRTKVDPIPFLGWPVIIPGPEDRAPELLACGT